MSAEAGSNAVDRSVFRLPLQTEHFSLEPLTADDFDALYAVASDPLLWAQHPEADRWKRSKFHHFFRAVSRMTWVVLSSERSAMANLPVLHDSTDTRKPMRVSGLVTPLLPENFEERQLTGRSRK